MLISDKLFIYSQAYNQKLFNSPKKPKKITTFFALDFFPYLFYLKYLPQQQLLIGRRQVHKHSPKPQLATPSKQSTYEMFELFFLQHNLFLNN